MNCLGLGSLVHYPREEAMKRVCIFFLKFGFVAIRFPNAELRHVADEERIPAWHHISTLIFVVCHSLNFVEVEVAKDRKAYEPDPVKNAYVFYRIHSINLYFDSRFYPAPTNHIIGTSPRCSWNRDTRKSIIPWERPQPSIPAAASSATSPTPAQLAEFANAYQSPP